MKIKEMELNKRAHMVLLVRGIEERAAKNGPYCRFTLSDTEQTVIAANAFSTSIDPFKDLDGKLVDVVITKGSYNGSDSYTLETQHIKEAEAEDADISDYVTKAPEDPDEMYQEIMGKLSANDPATRVVKSMYAAYKKRIMTWGAAKMMHHNYLHGLLYHTIRIMRAADALIPVYPEVNRDLIIAGAAAHDIGKIIELSTNAAGVSEYTISGELEGHIAIGLELLVMTAVNLDQKGKGQEGYVPIVNSEEFKLLKHMLLSHHGKAEWGAIKTPMTPEAVMLHFLDDMDSKLEAMNAALSQTEPGTLTEKVFSFGTRLYKSSLAPVEDPEEEATSEKSDN